MAREIVCWLEGAHVRSDREADLRELIRYLYQRRSLAYADSWDRIRHGLEIIRRLRSESESYRTISSESRGPFLFALGYFRIRDGMLEPIPSTLPDPEPEGMARLLSDFLAPGAAIYFAGEDDSPFGWKIKGVNEIEAVSPESAAPPE